MRERQVWLVSNARSVVLAAYQIAKPLAKSSDEVHSKLAPAIDFYAAPARKAARRRAERRKKEGGGQS